MTTHHEYRGYVFTIEQADGAYTADFPDLPEVVTRGDTLAGAFANACKELDLHLESLREADVPVPQPWHRIEVQNDAPQLSVTAVPTRELKEATRNRPIRWLQFGLKSALLLMLVAAAAAAWVRTERELADQRQQIAAFRQEMAGYQQTLATRNQAEQELHYAQMIVRDMERQLHETRERYRAILMDVNVLRDQGATIVDDETVVIGMSWQGGDARLSHLQAVEDLHNLHIADAKLTDAAAIHLSALDHLEELQLTNTGLTIEGWKRMRNLQELRVLHLGGPEVNDEWLPYIARLEKLQQLMLTRTSVTPEGVAKLENWRPQLQVHAR